MDNQTLDQIAGFICGEIGPLYRTGSELTRFFQAVGFSNIAHDGSTRKWWTLNTLKNLTGNNLNAVILRLGNPREYQGTQVNVIKAIDRLNKILMIEGIKVELDGVTPRLKNIEPNFVPEKEELEKELKPLPPPDFQKLKIEPALASILENRWKEAQVCIDSQSYLGAIILMGSMLEGVLLAACQRDPQKVNQSSSAPKNPVNNKVKNFAEWNLSEMINVSHEVGWIDLDVKKFSHALRDFRNLIHPYQQMQMNTYPDKDTASISWLVVQAAINDLSKILI